MADPVYRLLREKQGTELDKSYIYDVFDELITMHPELMDYIADFRVVWKPDGDLGNYLYEDRVIKVNRGAILQQHEVDPHVMAIEVVKHEMEHARNIKTLEEGKDDIESHVIKYGLRHYAMKHGMDTLSNIDHLYPDFLKIDTHMRYELDPAERVVRIKAWRYVVNLLKNQRRTQDLLDARKMLYYAYRRGYHDNRYFLEAPTLEFLLKTGMYHEFNWFKNRIAQKDYSFETRITYGLPVTPTEYEQKVLQKVRLQKKRVEP